MRHPRSRLLRNEITGNPWLWASLLLCTVLLVVPPYLPLVGQLLHLVPPSPVMWATILGMALAPLVVTQAVTVCLGENPRSQSVRSWRG
jgi:Ca2+-transporting ATPase